LVDDGQRHSVVDDVLSQDFVLLLIVDQFYTFHRTAFLSLVMAGFMFDVYLWQTTMTFVGTFEFDI
jgi:hypothetical protein